MSAPRRSFERSAALLKRAREVVPGASQTLSKNPRMFPENAYPAYLERGSGCRVWDVDGNEYVDYILGLASITLGYDYPAVTEAVRHQAGQGSIFSLPHPLEVEVSERLTEIIPCAEMVRFFKTGSEANAAAIRVARAATGRDVVALCGYHGWLDWYAITTPRSKGVPKDFAHFVAPFNFNDLPSLERVLDENFGKVAAVIMEATFVDAPAPGFLETVKTLAHRHGALFIFDEIVTGFRWAKGGAQEYFGVVPDLATLGKGLANGLPLAAVVGKKGLMAELGSDDVFVSSTFGGDTLALAAARATIDVYTREPVIERLWAVGRRFQEGFRAAAARVGVPVECIGYPVHPKIVFRHQDEKEEEKRMGIFLEQTAQRGVLFHFAGFNTSFSHSDADVDETVTACEQALGVIADGKIQPSGKPFEVAFKRS
jgi:glutamate-1-semialdehyde aminotransferase